MRPAFGAAVAGTGFASTAIGTSVVPRFSATAPFCAVAAIGAGGVAPLDCVA